MLNGTSIPGCWTAEYEKKYDDRGFFLRISSLDDIGISIPEYRPVQINLSSNPKSLTFRGLHMQAEPYGEDKIFSCISGSVILVVLDARKESHVRGSLLQIKLSSHDQKNRIVITPKYCATGYVTLEDNSSVMYQVNEFFRPSSCRSFNIRGFRDIAEWDIDSSIMSEADKNSQWFQ